MTPPQRCRSHPPPHWRLRLAAALAHPISRRCSDTQTLIEIWCHHYCSLRSSHIRCGTPSAPPFITGANRKSLLVPRSGRAAIKANAVSRQLIRRGEPAFLSRFQVFISDFPLFLSGSTAKPVVVLEASENISILLPNPLNIGIGGWRRRSSWEGRTFFFFGKAEREVM